MNTDKSGIKCSIYIGRVDVSLTSVLCCTSLLRLPSSAKLVINAHAISCFGSLDFFCFFKNILHLHFPG